MRPLVLTRARWRSPQPPARAARPRPAALDTAQREPAASAAWSSPIRASPPRSSRRARSRCFFDDLGLPAAILPRTSSARRRARSPTWPTIARGAWVPGGPRGLHARAGPGHADGLAHGRARRRGVARRRPAAPSGGTPCPAGRRLRRGAARPPRSEPEDVVRGTPRPSSGCARGRSWCSPCARAGLQIFAVVFARARAGRGGVGLRALGRQRRAGLRAHRGLARPARAAARAARVARHRRARARARARRGRAAVLAAGLARGRCSAGKLLGLFEALDAAQAVGFGAAGLVVFSQSGESRVSAGFLAAGRGPRCCLTAVFLAPGRARRRHRGRRTPHPRPGAGARGLVRGRRALRRRGARRWPRCCRRDRRRAC